MATATKINVTVCDFPDETDRKDAAWSDLIQYLSKTPTDVLVLPEMPFTCWIFDGEIIDAGLWRAAVDAHDRMIERMSELPASTVFSSRPLDRNQQRLNEAFFWTQRDGYHGIRSKWYLPDEPEGREALWFNQGDRSFSPIATGPIKAGVQLCSEMMYPEHARMIGLEGGQFIAQPRATGDNRRWRIAAGMSAVTSGCFIATANRRSFNRDWFTGGSWVLAPDAGVLAETSENCPFATATIDLGQTDIAKGDYPCDMHRMYAGA